MKIQITYTEVQTYQVTKEVEMTEKEYKAYLKLTNREIDEKFDLMDSIGDEHQIEQSILTINEKIV